MHIGRPGLPVHQAMTRLSSRPPFGRLMKRRREKVLAGSRPGEMRRDYFMAVDEDKGRPANRGELKMVGRPHGLRAE